MKPNEILLNIMDDKIKEFEEVGDDHVGTSDFTPLKANAFKLSDDEKIKRIADSFAEIMDTLGLDLTDDSLSGTPYRVAKMYVKEIFSGLDPKNKPEAKLFKNKYNYDGMIVVRDIELQSHCEHHFVPIIGKVHVAYYPTDGNVIGLSKLNRIVRHFGKRPQVQERLNKQILTELKEMLNTEDVAVIVDAFHFCVSTRGVKDTSSSTLTAMYRGKFQDKDTKNEFLKHIESGSSPK
jgi:GTP cyclohydrolase I